MAAIVLAAALALAPSAPAVSQAPPVPAGAERCRAPATHEAASAGRAAPHPLNREPLAGRMHAVLRKIGGCMVVDVAAYRQGSDVWKYRLAGPADVAPKPARVSP
ncbi:MAG TPA: hypothetical protein VKT30_12875 [Caulobacteraceae bacterium]|nr:hypothetical protein [Caulobacteraceae bacterium]